jgi:hypothetical protein
MIEQRMKIVVFAQLNMLTWLDKASLPVHPEALLELEIYIYI